MVHWQWIEEQLVPSLDEKPALLALDLFGGHKTDDVLDTFRAHDITISIIPAGCTGLLQLLDVSINGPFKNLLKVLHTLFNCLYFFVYSTILILL